MSADDPPQIGRWTGDPGLMVRRYFRDFTILWTLVILVCIGGLLMVNRLIGCGVFVVVGGLGITSTIMNRLLSRRRAKRPELDLLEGESGVDLAMVEAVFRRGRRVIGVDRGVMWVADGMVHFRGTACYFGLAGADFNFRKVMLAAVIEPWKGLEGSSVALYPLALPDEVSGERFERVVRAARELALARTMSDEPRTLPPQARPSKRKVLE